MVESNWFFRPAPREDARIRLFCFPHAGGGAAAFREWPAMLSSEIDVWAVQAPGRAWRLREAPFTDVEVWADEATEAMLPWLDRPFALFGHSLGSIVAFEVARRVVARGYEPEALFVGARRAPGLPARDSDLSELSDTDFVESICQRFGGIPPVILESEEVLSLMLPTLRADVAALEQYDYSAGPPLTSPLVVMGGTEDGSVSTEELDAWSAVSNGPTSVRIFEGDHFYVESHRDEVLSLVHTTLGTSPDPSPSSQLRR